MLEDIKEFNNKTKLRKASLPSGKTPIEYIHVFHKEYPRFPSKKLPNISHSGEFDNLLQRRRSERTFSDKYVSIRSIANILSSCRIVIKDPERRTYPSGGARFPVELYLVAFRIRGLDQGIYHFNINKFSLELLLQADLRKYEKELTSSFLKNVAGAIIFTSVMSRSEVKYGLRAYALSLLEAGYLGQNILLSLTKNKIGGCAVAGFVNDRVIELLDLTEDELPIHIIGFGYPIKQR